MNSKKNSSNISFLHRDKCNSASQRRSCPCQNILFDQPDVLNKWTMNHFNMTVSFNPVQYVIRSRKLVCRFYYMVVLKGDNSKWLLLQSDARFVDQRREGLELKCEARVYVIGREAITEGQGHDIRNDQIPLQFCNGRQLVVRLFLCIVVYRVCCAFRICQGLVGSTYDFYDFFGKNKCESLLETTALA